MTTSAASPLASTHRRSPLATRADRARRRRLFFEALEDRRLLAAYPIDQHTIALWHMDGPTGSSAKRDNAAGSSAFDLTEVRVSTAAAPGFDGTAAGSYALTGANEYLNVQLDGADYGPAMTIEGWVYVEDPTSGSNQMIYRDWDWNPYKNVSLHINSTGHLVGLRNGPTSLNPTPHSTAVSTQPLEADRWQHVAMTAAVGQPTKVFIDGQLAGTAPNSLSSASVVSGTYNGAQWGAANYHGNEHSFLQGRLDEFRISNIARTDSQILAAYRSLVDPLAAGLVGHWTFDEGSGTTASDASGNSNDGVLVDNPTWSPDTPGAFSSHSLAFDGDDYISVDHHSSLDLATNDFTTAAWIKADPPADAIVVLNKRDETGRKDQGIVFGSLSGGAAPYRALVTEDTSQSGVLDCAAAFPTLTHGVNNGAARLQYRLYHKSPTGQSAGTKVLIGQTSAGGESLSASMFNLNFRADGSVESFDSMSGLFTTIAHPGSYALNEWVDVGFDLDLDSNHFDLSIDGVTVAQAIPFATSAGTVFSAVKFQPAGNSTAFIDDVLVTRSYETLVVNHVGDAGDGVCDLAECTLREAIETANGQPGRDRIEFAIPEPDLTIRPQSPLPPITDPVVIDGFTQPGADTFPLKPRLIELDGSQAGLGNGLQIVSGSTTIRGLAIHSFAGDGIEILGPGDNVIEGNFLGTDRFGTSALGNQEHGIGISPC